MPIVIILEELGRYRLHPWVEADGVDRRWRRRRRGRVLADLGIRTHPHEQHALFVEWFLEVLLILVLPIVTRTCTGTISVAPGVITGTCWIADIAMV